MQGILDLLAFYLCEAAFFLGQLAMLKGPAFNEQYFLYQTKVKSTLYFLEKHPSPNNMKWLLPK